MAGRKEGRKQLSLTLHGGVKTRGKGAHEGGASGAMPTMTSIQQDEGGAPCDMEAVQEPVSKVNAMAPREKDVMEDQQGGLECSSIDEYLKNLETVVRAGVPATDLKALLDTLAEVAKNNGAKEEDLPKGVGLFKARGSSEHEVVQPMQDQNMVLKGERSRLRSACLQRLRLGRPTDDGTANRRPQGRRVAENACAKQFQAN